MSLKIRKTVGTVALAAGIALAAGCQKKADDTSSMTPGPETATEVAVAPEVPAEEKVTADPVVASQKNAAQRRRARESRPAGTASAPASQPPSSAPEPASAEVPTGTILRVAFDEAISTNQTKSGDRLTGQLLDDLLTTEGTVAAGSGSRVRAQVENAKEAGALGGRAELRFRVQEIEVGGQWLPVTTSAYEAIGETHAKKNIGYIAGGAAVGAILGQVLGKDTESTLKGAAAGAAAGTGAAAIQGGPEIVIEKGRTVAFTLEAPLIVRQP